MTLEEARAAIGATVTCSNGEPRPPAHHKAKLRKWGYCNYTGTIKSVSSGGIVEVIKKSIYGPSHVMVAQFIDHVRPERLTLAEERTAILQTYTPDQTRPNCPDCGAPVPEPNPDSAEPWTAFCSAGHLHTYQRDEA